MNSQQKKTNRWRILAVVAFVLLFAGLWPTSYLASPSWDVWVVTDDGQPIRGINVRLVYQNYSVERESHEVTLRTDEHGHVQFPPQYQRACLLQRAFYTAASARAGVHASFGRHAWVFAFGASYEGVPVTTRHYVPYWRGNPDSMQSRIVAKPVRP